PLPPLGLDTHVFRELSAVECQFLGSKWNRGEVLQYIKVIGEDKGTIVKALESRRSIFCILMVETHMIGWFQLYEMARAISTLMGRLTAGGDGSKLRMSKMEWVGRPSSGSFCLNGDHHRVSIIMGSWPSGGRCGVRQCLVKEYR
ncbi:hypothetical protein Ddye_025977, partial [Dipteronia dyeriana]